MQAQHERNTASSGEIGITIGSEAGIGIYVSASVAKGKGEGHGLSHDETQLIAQDTLALISGRDMTLEGAQARGTTILAQIGRNLSMTSQQDSNDYQRKDMSAGIDIAVGTGGASVSGDYGQSKINSTWSSVKEQTGFEAGAGGFDIRVQGHTHLMGAAIASIADPTRNRFETGHLSGDDLTNKAHYNAKSISVSAGTGGGRVNMAPPQHKKARSTTHAAIADGTLIVHDGSGSDIARSVTKLQQDALKDIFDLQTVSEKMELGLLASELAHQWVDDLHAAKLRKAQEPINALEQEQHQRGEDAKRLTASIQALPYDAPERREAEQTLAGLEQHIHYLGHAIDLARTERDSGHWLAISKTLAAIGVSALTGNFGADAATLQYVGTMGAAAFLDQEAQKAMRGHRETLAMKVTCHEKAQKCVDLANGMPSKASTDARLEYLREHGMGIDYVVEIPEGAQKMAVNGILNDAARATQVEIGHMAKKENEEGITFYLQYNATKGAVPDLLQAGYDKLITPINRDYSATQWALADAVKRQGPNADVRLYAHSWGTIVTRNVANILARQGYKNENLKVAAIGPAVRAGALVKPVKKIVGEEHYNRLLKDIRKDFDSKEIIPALSFYSNPTDPVSGWVGFNWWPSKYTNPKSADFLPGASRSSFLGSLFGFRAMGKTVNPHSCYGLNCSGSKYNWTIEKARERRTHPSTRSGS